MSEYEDANVAIGPIIEATGREVRLLAADLADDRDKRPFSLWLQGDANLIAVPVGNGKWELQSRQPPPAVQPPQPSTLTVATLTGLQDYLASNRDLLDYSKVLVHVASPTSVRVISTLKEPNQVRDCVLEAKVEKSAFPFGAWQRAEDMVVSLQALFDDAPRPDGQATDRAKLLKMVGSLKDEAVKTVSDDGVSQTVTARAGIVRVAEVSVPNPVYLAPFRTFREVLQPVSPFVVRVRGGGPGELPQIALHEADGQAWWLQAIEHVSEYLKTRLPQGVAIIA